MGGRQEVGPPGEADALVDLDVVGDPDAVDAELGQMRTIETASALRRKMDHMYQHYPDRNPHKLGVAGLTRATSRLREVEFDD